MTGSQGNQVIDKAALARISCPVYGFYAENDMRINATLPSTIEAMKGLNKTYEPVTYPGAGHGFMPPEKIQTTRIPRTRRRKKMRGSAGGNFSVAYELGSMSLPVRIDSEKLRYSRDRFLRFVLPVGMCPQLFEYV